MVKVLHRGDDIDLYTKIDGQLKLKKNVRKSDLIYRSNDENMIYLQQTFANNSRVIRFDDHNGHDELFYPYQINGKTIAVFVFSTIQYYGKLGS